MTLCDLRPPLSKHSCKRFCLRAWVEVGVSFAHFGGHVPSPGFNQPLIDATAGTGGYEAVPEAVPALNLFPVAVGKRSLQMNMGFIQRQRFCI